jgi:hypothetical protein
LENTPQNDVRPVEQIAKSHAITETPCVFLRGNTAKMRVAKGLNAFGESRGGGLSGNSTTTRGKSEKMFSGFSADFI